MAAWSGRRRWSSKHYIVAALLGTLLAIAAAAAISISLAPGHVSLAVTDASINQVTVNETSGTYNQFYNFTVVAMINSSRRRTEVRYGSLTAEIWYAQTSWILAEADNVNMTAGWWRDYAAVRVWADWGQYNKNSDDKKSDDKTLPDEMNNKNDDQDDVTDMNSVQWPNCLVRLEAKVRFRFGLVSTMPYTITASCFPVNFRDGLNSTLQCK